MSKRNLSQHYFAVVFILNYLNDNFMSYCYDICDYYKIRWSLLNGTDK